MRDEINYLKSIAEKYEILAHHAERNGDLRRGVFLNQGIALSVKTAEMFDMVTEVFATNYVSPATNGFVFDRSGDVFDNVSFNRYKRMFSQDDSDELRKPKIRVLYEVSERYWSWLGDVVVPSFSKGEYGLAAFLGGDAMFAIDESYYECGLQIKDRYFVTAMCQSDIVIFDLDEVSFNLNDRS